MGDVINFNEKSNRIEYDKYLANDCYLKTTALNGLKAGGYHLNRSGVLQFQHDSKLKETGVLSIDDLSVILMNFDPGTRQEVVNYMEKKRMDNKKKDKNLIPLILTLIGILFFELYGIISCFFDIVHLIKK